MVTKILGPVEWLTCVPSRPFSLLSIYIHTYNHTLTANQSNLAIPLINNNKCPTDTWRTIWWRTTSGCTFASTSPSPSASHSWTCPTSPSSCVHALHTKPLHKPKTTPLNNNPIINPQALASLIIVVPKAAPYLWGLAVGYAQCFILYLYWEHYKHDSPTNFGQVRYKDLQPSPSSTPTHTDSHIPYTTMK